jgi:hypothetical protein
MERFCRDAEGELMHASNGKPSAWPRHSVSDGGDNVALRRLEGKYASCPTTVRFCPWCGFDFEEGRH